MSLFRKYDGTTYLRVHSVHMHMHMHMHMRDVLRHDTKMLGRTCVGTYSGRWFMFDYFRKIAIQEN